MRLLLLFLLLPSAAIAAPWDGPRTVQDGADLRAYGWPVEAVEELFTITWAPGVEDSGPRHAADGPKVLKADGHTLRYQRRLASPRYHTDLYRLDGDASVIDIAALLTARSDVAVAAPLLQTGPGAWRAVTDRILIRTSDPAATQSAARHLGLEWVRSRGAVDGQYLLRLPHGDLDPLEAAMALRERPEVVYAQPDWIQPRVERFEPDDPRFPNQWHLENTVDNPGIEGNDLDAPSVWDITMGGEDVIVAVLDSGVDLEHEDLAEALLPGYDFVDGIEGGATAGSNHGTRVTGVAAAPTNGIGAVGVCPQCPILPGRVIGASDASEAEAHDWAVEQGAWVINNSWGPTDGTGQTTPIAPVTATAIDNATRTGRGGLGTPVFWAAGNGHPADTCTMDGLVAFEGTIGVGSSTNEGVRSSYSEQCPELELSSPSNGGTAGVNTTQIGGYTSNFGGTSAAAPGATGSAALVLAALPDLRFEDLRELLHLTAIKIDEEYAGYDDRGHSQLYGYGRVNPWSALQGGLLLEHANSVVGCSAQLEAKVILPLAPGQGSVAVTVTAPDDVEVFSLVEGAAGIYIGIIPLQDAEPVEGDGLVQIATGGEVTVESWDTGHIQRFVVDCDLPIIMDARVTVLSPWAARLSFRTFDDAEGWADWGTTRQSNLGTYHQIWAQDLEPCTTYVADIGATNPLGNEARVDDALTWDTPGDLGPLPDDPPEDADPCDPTTWGDDDDSTPPVQDDDDSAEERVDPPPYTASPGCSCDGSNAVFLLPLFLFRRRR